MTARVAGAVDRVLFPEGELRHRPARPSSRSRPSATAWPSNRPRPPTRRPSRQGRRRGRPEAPRDGDHAEPRAHPRRGGRDLADQGADGRRRGRPDRARPSTRPSSTCATPSSRRPSPGIIQTRTVQTGQYVQTGTVLATLVRRDPLLLQLPGPRARRRPACKPGHGGPFPGPRRQPRVHGQDRPRGRVRRRRLAHGRRHRRHRRHGRHGPAPRLLRRDHRARRLGAAPPRSSPVSAVRPSERGFLAFVVEDEQGRRAHPDPGHAHRPTAGSRCCPGSRAANRWSSAAPRPCRTA
ncbi:MAG: HlyD family secretion protein [Anaerotruncus sp.]|nr:HlyD family secretion protein [Anaerotruncus sp.]